MDAGTATLDLLRAQLLPYQVEGMLHLAFGERVLLADEMGLGKTIQAIAAVELLRRRRGITRVLVVLPGVAARPNGKSRSPVSAICP